MAKSDPSESVWFRGEAAVAEGPPGIVHSFPACLAGTLASAGEPVDAAKLMGATGFAFRI